MARSKQRSEQNTTVTISMDKELDAAIKARCQRLRISVSAYFRMLAAQDVEGNPKLVPVETAQPVGGGPVSSTPSHTGSTAKIPVLPGTPFEKLHNEAVQEEARRQRAGKGDQSSSSDQPRESKARGGSIKKK